MKQLTVEKIENRAKDIIAARSKIYLLEYISKSKKSVLQECLEFGIPRSTFYEWKKKYELEGKDGSRIIIQIRFGNLLLIKSLIYVKTIN